MYGPAASAEAAHIFGNPPGATRVADVTTRRTVSLALAPMPGGMTATVARALIAVTSGVRRRLYRSRVRRSAYRFRMC